MEFETPFGTTVPMKLFEISADITADHKKHVVLDMPFHGWFGLSPYLDTPSERVFWVLQRAGVKWILADGSGGGINPLLDPGDVIIPDDLIDQTKRVSYLSKFTDKIVRMRDIVARTWRPSCTTRRSRSIRASSAAASTRWTRRPALRPRPRSAACTTSTATSAATP